MNGPDKGAHDSASDHRNRPGSAIFQALFGSCTGTNYRSYNCDYGCTGAKAGRNPYEQAEHVELRSKANNGLVGSYINVPMAMDKQQVDHSNSNASFLSHPEDLTMSTANSSFNTGITSNQSRIVTPEETDQRRIAISADDRRAARAEFVNRYRRFQYTERHMDRSQGNSDQVEAYNHQHIEPCETMNTLGTVYSSEFASAWNPPDDVLLQQKKVGQQLFPRVISRDESSFMNSIDLRRIPGGSADSEGWGMGLSLNDNRDYQGCIMEENESEFGEI